MLKISLFALSLLLLASAASVAHAQERVAIRVTDEAARRELESIDRQSSSASQGYGWSTAGLILGGSVLTLGVLVAINPLGEPDDVGLALCGIGGVLAGAGVLGMILAIDADLTSGQRRERWRQSHGMGHLALSIAPTPDGLSISLAGTF